MTDIKELNKNGLKTKINLDKYGLSTFGLKIIAIITMFMDHFAILFLGGSILYTIFRAIGRISFPIFAFLIVEGFFHTKNRKKYALRLFIFAVISEIPYNFAFSVKLVYIEAQNIFFTLFIGLVAIWALHSVSMGCVKYSEKFISIIGFAKLQMILKFIIMAAALGLSYIIKCSYSYAGVFLIICFYVFYEHHVGKALTNAFFNIAMFGGIQSVGTLSVMPIALYNGKIGKYKWKWFFYLFYPVHLVILVGIKILTVIF